MTPVMELRGVRVRYGPLEALHGVDLPVPAGAVTVLTGRNGSGRTTVLRVLAGTVAPAAGAVLWHGRDVGAVPAHRRARLGLCLVPGERAVHETLTVADNLEAAARGGPADAALAAYPELGPLLDRPAATLSGGEQRMLAVARALVTGAEVLLLDEPARGMAPAAAARTYALLCASGAAVVLAEQRLPDALRAPARVPVVVHGLRRGTVVFRGEAAEYARRAGPPPAPPP
ncbi:ATP-binding cassette domain-containing protein [Streptomyces zhihengii]|uniref:ATP-binding cassette domain-containing protein n=1 Tax=Streptomyces zhihengii TaxID=1818004 RepID=UPI00362ABB07